MDKEQKAFERLKLGANISEKLYGKPLIICYSGGKDSDLLLQLAINAGINFEVLHSHTTVDAPETVYHIRDTFRRLEERGIKCSISYPKYKNKRVTMWSLIPTKGMPPTRLVRYCCSILKEQGGEERAVATGVRWAESNARKQRGIYESIRPKKEDRIVLQNDNDDKREFYEECQVKRKTVINPIVDWTDSEVFDYLAENKTILNPLYKEGFCRIGCVGCPMARKKNRYFEFRRYPTYKQAYIHAFEKMLEARKARGKKVDKTWQSGYDVFRWWMEENPLQIEFSDNDFITEV